MKTVLRSRFSVLSWLVMVLVSGVAFGTTYYVDPAGSNGNNGLSQNTPWRTLLKVGISTFQPGDVILLKRDGVWNEWLTPPSSGAPGNRIRFDAYGQGRPPELTGLYQTKSADWGNISGNVWEIALTTTQLATQLKFVQFGTVWGNGQSSQADLARDRDWYYDPDSQNLFVYSSGGNPVSYYGSVAPVVLSGQSLINIKDVNYVEIQHMSLDWYDGYGVQVQGNSDHLWLANMSADSQVPNATVPIGFYVHPGGTPGDIHLFNVDAHRNYIGYRFDGSGTSYELTNCRAYANRTYGLMDNTGHVTYDYCHLYANNLATGMSTDVSGGTQPIDGGHNIAADMEPDVREFRRYPARISLTYDDPGLLNGSQQYINGLLPMIQAKGVPLSIAVVTGYDLSDQLIPTFQSWIDAGWDLNCHSVSHQYFVYLNGFAIQYTGTSASSVTLSISNKRLTIDAPGDANAQVSWNLATAQPPNPSTGLDSLGGLIYTIKHRGVFSVVQDPNMKSAVKSQDLVDVNAQDIMSAPYTLLLDKTRLMTDELNWSKAWMDANLTGLPSTRVYVYPGSYEDASTEAIAVAAGYAGARGSLVNQPSPNAASFMGTGINLQNVLSQGSVPVFQHLTAQQLHNKIRALVFKSQVWGLPIGIFWHKDELSADEVSHLIDELKSAGAVLVTNTQLVTLLATGQLNAGTTNYVLGATGPAADFRPTVNSVELRAGAPLDPEFKYDILGIDQTAFSGWGIGAYALQPSLLGGLLAGGETK